MIQRRSAPRTLRLGARTLAVAASQLLLLCANAHAEEQLGANRAGPTINQCWSAAELRGRAVDKLVRKSTPRAIVSPPSGNPIDFRPIPAADRGAIRRVELPAGVKRIAFTFDLCEQPYEVAGYDAQIVNYLRQESVRATFFGGGKWLETHSEQAQQLVGDPLFELGNHTWAHRNLRILSKADAVQDVRWTQIAYEKQLDALTRRQCAGRDGKLIAKTNSNKRMFLFRFPFGACDEEALNIVGDLGLLAIQWDVSSGDPSERVSAAQMAADVLHRVRPGSIVLFHANGRGWHTGAALPLLVPELRRAGYEFVTVGELLATPGAKVDREPVCYDSKAGDTNRYDALARRLEAQYARFERNFARTGTDIETEVIAPRPVPATRPNLPSDTK